MEFDTLDTEIAKGLMRILLPGSMRRVQIADVQREKDKAPNLTWEHMASTSARTVKVATYQNKRFGSNKLLDTEPRSDDLKSFADRSWDETAMVLKIKGTATDWKSHLPPTPPRKFCRTSPIGNFKNAI